MDDQTDDKRTMVKSDLLTDSGHSRSDLRMVETAIRKGWQIPDQLLEALPKIAGAMALKGKPRDQIAAMALLVKMKEQNNRQEALAAPKQLQQRQPRMAILNAQAAPQTPH